MTKENLNNIITPDETTISVDVQIRGKLVDATAIIIGLRRRAEESGLAAGSSVAENVILRNIPVLNYITDGNLRSDLKNDNLRRSAISERANSLPIEIAKDTQNKIDLLLSVANSASSVAMIRRLTSYLSVVMPRTRDGLEALRFIAKGYNSTPSSPMDSQILSSINESAKLLFRLDSSVIAVARKDGSLLQSLSGGAMEQAKLRLSELKAENSTQIARMRSIAAEKEISGMRHDVARTEGDREYSTFEVLVNEIIQKEQLTERAEEIEKKKAAIFEKSKQAVLSILARKRAVESILPLLDSDPLLCRELAKRHRMTPEELLSADESVKKQVVNNALNSRKKIVLSTEERRVFSGDAIIAKERKQLALDLQNPLLFISTLSEEDYKVICSGIPRISNSKSIYEIAKDRLRQQVGNAVTENELLDILTQEIVRDLLSERCADAVDLAIKLAGINPNSALSDPTVLSNTADSIVPLAIKNLRATSTRRNETTSARVETEQPKKSYEYTVPLVTIGKSQLVSPINLLRFGTSVTMAQTPENLSQALEDLIQSSSEFEGYFSSGETAYYYPPEKKAEMLFSMVGRGAGSKLAGTPLFELRDDMAGVIATIDPAFDRTLETREKYGSRVIVNSVRLSPLTAKIGQPYKDRLVEATRVVAQGVDTVAGNLNTILGDSPKTSIPVEDVTNYVRDNLNQLLNKSYEERTPGRSVLQMDYFLLYPEELRRAILEAYRQTGSLESLMPLLARYTTDGKIKMTIFDVSGGSGGVGISEILSQKILGRESGHMKAYLDALLESYVTRVGRLPQQVLIAPREADLTLMNFEYTIVENALKARGIPAVGISTLEILQQSLEVFSKNGSRLQVPTLKGEIITPELIIKRFTFFNEGKGTGYRGDILTRLPQGVVLEPNNASRVIASDKRINSPILRALEPKLQELGVEVMPYLDLDIQGTSLEQITREIVRFMKDSRETYPEIDYLGAVLKTADKIPGREGGAGEVISAYPVPASVIENPEMQRLFIAKKIRELALKGVTGVIVQPNVLSLVVDNNGVLMPKYELKMMAFANQRR